VVLSERVFAPVPASPRAVYMRRQPLPCEPIKHQQRNPANLADTMRLIWRSQSVASNTQPQPQPTQNPPGSRTTEFSGESSYQQGYSIHLKSLAHLPAMMCLNAGVPAIVVELGRGRVGMWSSWDVVELGCGTTTTTTTTTSSLFHQYLARAYP
jgi:hypothetical protein